MKNPQLISPTIRHVEGNELFPWPFSHPGLLVPGAVSVPWTIHDRLEIAEVSLALGSSGSEDTSVEVTVNGVTAFTVTIPAGDTVHVEPVSCFVVPGDTVNLVLASVGTDAANVAVIIYTRRRIAS